MGGLSKRQGTNYVRAGGVDGYNALCSRQPTKSLCQAGKFIFHPKASPHPAPAVVALAANSLTVGDAALMWIDEGKRRNLERSTTDKRWSHYQHHMRPFFAATLIQDPTPVSIDEFITHLSETKCANGVDRVISSAMVRKILASLKGLLRHSERLGYLKFNPAEPISFRNSTRGRRRIRAGWDFPTKQEIRDIVAGASARWRPLFLTAALTGMRSSELRGLSWDDVDFERKLIHVRQRADAWGVIGAPKSEAGEREIPMMPSVFSALYEWKTVCPRRSGNRVSSDLLFVFPNGKGNTESHSNIVNRGLLPLQIELGILELRARHRGDVGGDRGRYGLHALRHFFSTYMIESGISPKRLQVMLGHSTFAMTMDTYGHLFEDSERDRQLMAGADTQLFAEEIGSA